MTKLDNPGFRYTFPRNTLANIEGLEPGLYEMSYVGGRVVLNVDNFGEIRVANETPTNNMKRFAYQLMKVCNDR